METYRFRNWENALVFRKERYMLNFYLKRPHLQSLGRVRRGIDHRIERLRYWIFLFWPIGQVRSFILSIQHPRPRSHRL